jgi:hypothetical protein
MSSWWGGVGWGGVVDGVASEGFRQRSRRGGCLTETQPNQHLYFSHFFECRIRGKLRQKPQKPPLITARGGAAAGCDVRARLVARGGEGFAHLLDVAGMLGATTLATVRFLFAPAARRSVVCFERPPPRVELVKMGATLAAAPRANMVLLFSGSRRGAHGARASWRGRRDAIRTAGQFRR